MYRCVALKAIRAQIPSEDAARAAEVAGTCVIAFEQGDPQRVFLDGEDVTDAVRVSEVGNYASAVSVHSAVRRILVAQQQAIVAQGCVVLEGRDTTTVVAPLADLKIYLTASISVRAARRFRELANKGEPVQLDELESQIEARDLRDSTREDSPLRVASDAKVVDTDSMAIDEVVALVEAMAKRSTSS